ncbi:hypothetical protein M8J76_008729 [Diaphorina citri]|nr:hypothetical protein M8J75_000908 [Diaphorina citri]KAI5719337.1 hypothetical protein M8J76_008729 [Diaphorina citri]KAI5720044.1 hypothetical protein M8J77_001060 [Diaphorina citri]
MKLNEDVKQEPKKSEYFVDIKRIPDFQLLEIFERQAKILKNKFIVSKLPDKGQKLIEKNNAIQNELETRQKATDDIISSIREMKIDCTASNEKKTKHSNQLNSEKKQPSLSSSCSSLSQEGTSSIEVQNLADHSTTIVDKFAVNRNERLDQIDPPSRFIPAQSAKVKEPKRVYGEKDLSAACMPNKKFDVKQLPLSEVVKLKGRETTYLKELEIKEAQERLTSLEFSTTAVGTSSLSYTPMNYRSNTGGDSDESEGENEEHGILEEEDDDRRGTISYAVED